MWAVYPRKIEKAAARKAYVTRLRDGWSPDELYLAAKEYAANVSDKVTPVRGGRV